MLNEAISKRRVLYIELKVVRFVMSAVPRELHLTVLSPTYSGFCGGFCCVKGIVTISCLHLGVVDCLKAKLPQIRVTEQGKHQHCKFPSILYHRGVQQDD